MEDTLPNSKIIPRASAVANLNHSYAIFYRTGSNSNVNISIPLGTQSGNIYTSGDVYLPSNIFNSINSTSVVSFSNAEATILADQVSIYDISIQCKLIQNDGYNFINQRSIYTTLVNNNNDEYAPSMANILQPDTGAHETITIKGSINHTAGDIIKIKLSLIQDNTLDGQTDSTLVIFNLSWNITSLL